MADKGLAIARPELPVVFVMGPTASGKTALAMELYQQGGFEIISVDSALIYRDMDIGTAKPTKDELAKTPHHLIDIRDPAESYSAAQFCEDAIQLINQVHAAGKVPLLVGGTMLYFKALKEGLAELPEADPEIRDRLSQELQEEGIEALHQKLADVDPVTAQRLKVTDKQRILRALEVWRSSSKPLSWWHQHQKLKPLSNPLLSIALAPEERKILHERIASRFSLMMELGFLQEVEALYQRPDLNPELPSVKCVGYRQLWQYLDGELSLDEAIERGIIATRQLAKRQYTWLRSWSGAHWFDPTVSSHLDQAIDTILTFSKIG